jgi:hypothetical protein
MFLGYRCNAREPEPGEIAITGTVIIGGRHYAESDRRRSRREAAATAPVPDGDLRMRESQTPGLGAPGDLADQDSMPVRARDEIDLDMALRQTRPRTGQRHDSAN